MKFEKQNIPFTMVANEVLTRNDVSLKAKGLFAYLFSKPDGWDFSADRIAKECKEERKSILLTLKELEKASLLLRKRQNDGRNKYKITYAVSECGHDTTPLFPQSTKAVRSKIGTVPKAHGAKSGLVSNIEHENKKDIGNAPKGAGGKEKKDPDEPMSQEQFVESCKSNSQRHIQIIGEWAEAEGPKHTRRGQWEAFLRRNLRAAKELVAFTTPEIETAYHRMMKDVVSEQGGRKTGFLSRYTLETLAKYTTA